MRPSLEPAPTRSVDLGKHSVETHFPKDRNCEICQRTKNARAPCRRRIGGAVPRAENFGDLITADHKVLSDMQSWCRTWPPNGSSRIRAKQKLLRKHKRSLLKFLDPDRKPKVIYTDNSLEFGKACEDISWNHCTSTPHRSETHGIAERAVRRVKEGISAVLLQSGLDEHWWADSMECYTYLRSIQDLLYDGKLHTKDVLENRLKDQSFRLVRWLSITYFCERPGKNPPSIWKESLTWIVPWIRFVRGLDLEGWHVGCGH